MILKIVIVLALVVALVLIFAATRPNTLTIQRSIIIQASPEKVFALLDDFQNWPRWAPQDNEDSTLVRSYSGPASGLGAVSEWSGKGNSGQGRITITASEPPRSLTASADWVRPIRSHNENLFLLESAGTQTRVTWTWKAENLFPMKLMGLAVNMDRMMGSHFDSGLARLKRAAEE
jgi:uncharacterized protein YndB with AHSA1/START domain